MYLDLFDDSRCNFFGLRMPFVLAVIHRKLHFVSKARKGFRICNIFLSKCFHWKFLMFNILVANMSMLYKIDRKKEQLERLWALMVSPLILTSLRLFVLLCLFVFKVFSYFCLVILLSSCHITTVLSCQSCCLLVQLVILSFFSNLLVLPLPIYGQCHRIFMWLL